MDGPTIRFGDLSINLNDGLNFEQVVQSARKYGPNTLTPPERDPWWKQFLEKFDDPTIRILLAAAVISLKMTVLEKFVLGHPEASFIDSIGIFLAVMLATLCGFFSELKSAREFDLLNKVKDDILIKVLRDGQITEVSINGIVMGDMVHLDLGDKVPADGVVINAMGLLLDQSVMTGESVPVEKQPLDEPGIIAPGVNGEIEDRYRLYRGTMVVDGHGMFLVTEVGDKTRLGQIAANLGKEGESENATPLTQKLSVLARQISAVGVCSAMMIFMVMAISSIVQSRLFAGLLADVNPLIGLSVFSLILGFLVMRFVLRPFFSSMNMDLNDLRLQLLASVPMIVAVFGVCLGVWGVFDDHGNVSLAMEIFRGLLTCFVVAVTIIVVAVPEGLPMMVTVSLALNMMKMARENCLIRKLVASETIGSATVICTDKTGTLTQNRMSTAWVMLGMKQFDFQTGGATHDEIRRNENWPLLVESISANSEAALHIETIASKSGGKEKIEGIGNPTECALLRLLHKTGVDYREFRDKYPRVWELSHNSQRKLSLVVVDRGKAKTCFIKGAPDKLLGLCSYVLAEGELRPIESYRPEIQSALDAAAGKALRVIAFTVKDGDGRCFEESEGEKCLACPGHTLLGLIGIADPIRPEVKTAVGTCVRAGVAVKMITGDAEPTAIAIARQAGILSEAFDPSVDNETEIKRGELVLNSAELAAMDDQKLLEAIPSLKVLARSTPMDKLRLVKAMHREGEVVAMTGDGTNDAPALKFADVGISMGITGTEVAKEASDIVLVDDDFKSIVTGIWWGRTLYQNIQRFLQFQLSVNTVALSCALIGPLVGIPLPLTVPQLLWINIIMDTFAAIAMSCDPPRRKSMDRRPISRDASIITPSMGLGILLNSLYQVGILFAALYFGWFLSAENRYDFSADPMGHGENLQALTVFFTIFIMFQFWHKFNCRSLRYDESPFELLHKNKLFLLIVGVITVVQIVMVQASDYLGIGDIFRSTALSPSQWLKIASLTVTIIPVSWAVRLTVNRLGFEETPGNGRSPA